MRNHEEMFSDCDEQSEDENRVARTGILNKNRLITKLASSETNTTEKEHIFYDKQQTQIDQMRKEIQALQNELKKTQTFPKHIQSKKYTNTKYVNRQPQPRNRNWNQHQTRGSFQKAILATVDLSYLRLILRLSALIFTSVQRNNLRRL